ncbi:hypothetical protein [Haloarcula litorea]|uniref:hypothetical protein n=1 Tax=Haloarcula litorea TaxID=3032579 RepID=UPI0023E7FF37|nr:hypothetical protein [Halomicroarcula sp. GDY20]
MVATRVPAVVCLCVLLVLGSVPAAVAAPAATVPQRGPATADAGGSLGVTYTVDPVPERPGRVRVTADVTVPERVTGLALRPPEDATVTSADGLVSTGHRWQWAPETGRAPGLTYTVPVGLDTAHGKRTAATDDWTLVVRREVALRARWRWDEGPDPHWDERLAVADGHDGVATDTAAYVGPHRTLTRETAGGTVRLVVPEAATLGPDPAAVFHTIGEAQRRARAGPTHDRLTVIATPNGLAGGGYTPADGHPTVLVDAGQPVAAPTNVWVHEARHTRQAYRTTAGMAWLDEGSADYYAARATLRQGRIDRRAYRARVTTDDYRAVDLTEPDAWPAAAVQYEKGVRVVAAVDARVRQATGGERTFRDVLVRFTQADRRVSLAVFAETVSAVAGVDLRAYVRAAVTGRAPPVPTALAGPGGTGLPAPDATGGSAGGDAATPDGSERQASADRVGVSRAAEGDAARPTGVETGASGTGVTGAVAIASLAVLLRRR